MWHKPSRTFHPWCLCIKTRCLLNRWFQLDVEESRQWLQCIQYLLCSNDFAKFWSNAPDVGLFHKVYQTCLNKQFMRYPSRISASRELAGTFQLPEHKGTIRTPNIIHKMPVRYILSSVWVRLSIFSQLSIIQSIIQYVGLCVFSLPTPLVMIERIYILCLIIIIKSEVWTITQCLGLGHETMVCAVCFSIFLYKIKNIFQYFINI